MPAASRNFPEAPRYLLKVNGASGIEGVFFRLSVLSAQFAHTHQLFSSHPQVRQGEQRGQLGRVFHQATKAYFHITELPFDHPKRMLDLGPRLSFAVLDLAFGLVMDSLPHHIATEIRLWLWW